jgi:type IV pilus modification protein PilV
MPFNRAQRGMTLIEVLVALSILAIAILALAPLFTISVKTNASAHQLTNANTLAREKLEELSG